MSIASNRLKFLSIFALFLLPLLAAFLIFGGKLPLPSNHTVNQGKLIQPPVALDWTAASSDSALAPAENLQHSWVILFSLPPNCAEACLQKVTGLRQVHKASGREQQRLQLVLLSPSPISKELQQQLTKIYDQFSVLTDPSGSIQGSLLTAGQRGSLADTELISYLVDPLGNIMMAYDVQNSEAGMSKDLKRLLTWSKQDKS